jgi:hypothetical protein
MDQLRYQLVVSLDTADQSHRRSRRCPDAHGQSALGSQDHLGYAAQPRLQNQWC